jgi:hypothetical protein
LAKRSSTYTSNFQTEEAAHFRRQIVAEHVKFAAAGRSHLQLQDVPIGKPDAIPRKIWKEGHGKADERALTGAEIAEQAHHERETGYRQAIAAKKCRYYTPRATTSTWRVPIWYND